MSHTGIVDWVSRWRGCGTIKRSDETFVSFGMQHVAPADRPLTIGQHVTLDVVENFMGAPVARNIKVVRNG
jgi:cold shock CspA family protein